MSTFISLRDEIKVMENSTKQNKEVRGGEEK